VRHCRVKGRVVLPSGSVIALDSQDGCAKLGDGWIEPKEFVGKTIVGAASDRGATEWSFRVPGGKPSIQLTHDNMPTMFFKSESVNTGSGGALDFILDASENQLSADPKPRPGRVFALGREFPTPIELMPPYIPLHLCERK
jgi:hypothetical protein